jgi:hypothetical protein
LALLINKVTEREDKYAPKQNEETKNFLLRKLFFRNKEYLEKKRNFLGLNIKFS